MVFIPSQIRCRRFGKMDCRLRVFGVSITCFSLVAVFSSSPLSTMSPTPIVKSLTPSVLARSVSAMESRGDDVGSFVNMIPILGADGLPCSRNISLIFFKADMEKPNNI